MLKFLKSFRGHDDGAVTVDWVVLTAATVGLSAGIITSMSNAATDTSTSVGAQIAAKPIETYN